MKINPISSYIQAQNKSFLPIFLIIGSFILISFVVIPQFSSIGELRSQISQKQDHLQTLRDSIKVLNDQSDSTLDSEFSLVDSALPNTKRVVNIFNTLADASVNSGVSMNSFEVKVGNVYQKDSSAHGSDQSPQAPVQGVPYLTVVTQVNTDDERNIVKFAQLLSTKFPLSEINTTNISADSGSIEIQFFYKPYNLDQLAQQEAIQPLDASEQKTLNQLKTWSQE